MEETKEDIEIYKQLKRQKNKLSNKLAIGILSLVFILPIALAINVYLGIIFFFADVGYLLHVSKKWKEFEETALTYGYDVTAWGDLKRIK